MVLGRQETNVREFTVVIEQDEEGYLVATVPELQGCPTQARSLDELMGRVREVILRDVELSSKEFLALLRK